MVRSQECDLTIMGNVYDEASESPLSYVTIFIQETQEGAVTDDDGNFVFELVCPGEYHFIFSHIGCEGKKFHFHIDQDTTLNIALSHSSTILGTVVVDGKKNNFGEQANSSVNRQSIEDNTNQNISGILENETGVHLIKNGNGISKPVVHGLYGNRLSILNNGILQSGQQWGNDHSPEIDPFSSDKITILKGAAAIEYGGGNLGAVVLSEPKGIEDEPHLHGQINYNFETNGLGHTINTRLEKYASLFAWRLNGTLKKYGDKRSANYYLNNTGLEEANLSFQAEKSWGDDVLLELYASTFNTTLGVLRGSHIGNLTDLEQALTNEVPFFTEDKFSYEIDAPKQVVSHHLIKGKLKLFLDESQIVDIVLAGQMNDRKEFDVRRGDRADMPSLSLSQLTFNGDISYSKHFGEELKLKFGNQNIITNNRNNPGTGILPLIPDYSSWKSGLFGTLAKTYNKTFLNVGLRYDYEDQLARTISNSLPREIIRYENRFHNLSALLTVKSNITRTQSLAWNIGYAMRNPAINELYSSGLHQGVSGIEEGSIDLETERAIKNTLEYKFFPNSDFTLNALVYYQRFKDYIYLRPQEEIRLTIRGAFPVFKYEQTDANIYGLDLSTQVTFSNTLYGLLKFSYIKGEDSKNDLPLIFVPPNNLYASLTYRVQNAFSFSNNVKVEETEVEMSNRLVLRKNDILEEQDFVLPPATYNLLELKLSTNLILPSYKIRCFVKADNLFNTQYRDYLNRQRYFADDLGISVTIGVNIKF